MRKNWIYLDDSNLN